MTEKHRSTQLTLMLVALLLAFIVSGCNLAASPGGIEELTPDVTSGALATRTPAGTLGAPTRLPLTSLAPTRLPGQFPTSVVNLPPTANIPAPQPQPNPQIPVSIVILSPIPGNVVAGNVQVLGSATHPQFLQYQLEYGPDPNPGNLWYSATGPVQQSVLNNLLGIWNTGAVQDGTYQLRLRVFLRDATSLSTVVNNIRIQNQAPTQVPSATPNEPRPIAAFTVDQNQGQAPLVVRFSNQSNGSINNYQWNFGDGSTSNDRNANHRFTSPGLYNVTLTVSGPGGSSNVSTQINVQSQNPPVAGFTADRFSGPAPLTVQFTDTSAGNVTSYHWNFSDGTGSTDRNPSHIFTTPGTYNVFLTIIGPGGSTSTRREITVNGPTQTPPPTLEETIVVPPTSTAEPTETEPAPEVPPAQPPVANFTSAPSGDLTVQFTDASSSSAEGGLTGWQWDFGDGQSNTEQSPLHTYAAAGNYTVTLTITDAAGSHSTSQNVSVTAPEAPPVQPPVANFTSAPSGDLTIQFTDASASSDPTGVTGWQWDFGDGNSSIEQNPLHTYAAPGDYTVTLTVTDAAGNNSSSQSISVAAPAQPPVANFSAAPAGDLAIQFTDSSTSGDQAIASWQWDFGDGQSSTEQNPLHTYGAPGDYSVTLIVSNEAGSSQPASQNVSVAAPAQPPVSNFSAAPSGDLTVQFSDASTSSDPAGIAGWQWDFGDGNSSSEQSPLYTYAAAGDYTVTLTVTDASGSHASSQTVSVTAPEAPPQSGLQESAPVLPDWDDDLRNTVRSVFENGQAMGNRANVFSVAGDETAQFSAYLDPFNNPSDFALDDSTAGLQGVIDFFTATDLGGATSFNANSAATGNGWKVGDLLNPDRADGSRCNPGETPLACEFRLTQPAVVLISIGMNDVTGGTDINEFRAQLQQVVQSASNAGVIPVLSTIQPRPDNADRVREFNDAIIEIGDGANVPVYNLWRSLSGLPNSGLNGDNASLSQAPGVPGDITSGATANGGVNTRNRDTLQLLESLRSAALE